MLEDGSSEHVFTVIADLVADANVNLTDQKVFAKVLQAEFTTFDIVNDTVGAKGHGPEIQKMLNTVIVFALRMVNNEYLKKGIKLPLDKATIDDAQLLFESGSVNLSLNPTLDFWPKALGFVASKMKQLQ